MAPIFLSADDVFRIIQRELPPDDVYPDGEKDDFFSTSDSYSTAKVIADYYEKLRSTYVNQYPISADERLSDFEFLNFGFTLDAALILEERRTRLLAKIRTLRRTTPQDMRNTAYTIIDSNIPVEIVEWGCGDAGWVLDVSQLEIETILNEFNQLGITGGDLCALGAADFGVSEEEYLRMRAESYTYEVRIYGYTLTADERFRLDQALNGAEPCRSLHIIVDGLNPADMIGGET